MKQNNFICKMSYLLILLLPIFLNAQTADLELTMMSDNPQVGIYDYITITTTLRNTGTQSVNNAVVKFNIPADVAMAGSSPPNAEQGSIEGFYGGTMQGEWFVGTVSPGQSLDFDITYFTLSENSTTFYGQVFEGTNNDPDSTPGNGTCCTAYEDDEAAYTFPNEETLGCTYEEAYAELICNDNNTPNDVSDDTYTLSFRADGSNGMFNLSIPELNYNQTAAYSVGFINLTQLSSNTESLELIFSDAQDTAGCGETITVYAPSAGCGNSPSNSASDLELSVGNTPTPGIYAEAYSQFVLKNTSNTNATGIQVTFSKNGLNVTDIPTVSHGFIDLYWTDNPVWNIGTLAPNQVAVINFDLYTMATNYSLYGEVSAQNETDADSTPNNGNGINPQEDDEAVYTNGGATPSCNLTITDTDLRCASTTMNSSFIYSIKVGGAAGNSVNYEILGTSFSGVIATGQLVDIATLAQGTDFTVVVTDPNSENCDYYLTSNIPVAPSICFEENNTTDTGADVTLSVTNNLNTATGIYQSGEVIFTLTNTGTTNASGLTVTFSKDQLNVTWIPTTTVGTPQYHWTNNPVWQVGTLAPGQSELIIFPIFTVGESFGLYGEVTAMTETDIDSTPNNGNGSTPVEDDEALWFRDSDIVLTVDDVIEPLTTQAVDLELTASGPSGNISIYNNYSVTYTLTNAGNVDATGIMVQSPRHSTVVFQGGNEFTASQGSFNYYETNTLWNVGNLAAGETATITMNFFTLSTGSVTNYAFVIDQNESDLDSTPDLWNCCGFAEDDEAAAIVNVVQNTPDNNPNNLFVTNTLTVLAYPVPVQDFLTVDIASETSELVNLRILDVTGRAQISQDMEGIKGAQTVRVSVTDLEEGIYLLSVRKGEENVIQRFVKM